MKQIKKSISSIGENQKVDIGWRTVVIVKARINVVKETVYVVKDKRKIEKKSI